MIVINDQIAINENDIELRFVRSGGPGGQHVNKVSTAVQLRFDAASSEAIPKDVLHRLRKLSGSRMNEDGVLTIESSEFRSQKRNRDAAVERLVDLLTRATRKPKKRKKTQPTAAAKERRVEEKRRRSRVKQQRRPVEEPRD